VLGTLVAAVYTEALDILLSEAIEVETEADLGRSQLSVTHFLIQSMFSFQTNVSYSRKWSDSLYLLSKLTLMVQVNLTPDHSGATVAPDLLGGKSITRSLLHS